MEKLIYYPGLDPLDRNDLKTFIKQDVDIVFFYHNKKHLHWHFNNRYVRDQAFAFLLDNYTDRPKGIDLKRVLDYEQIDFIRAVISDYKIMFRRTKGLDPLVVEIEPTESQPSFNSTEFHLLIRDICNQRKLKYDFVSSPCIPYPDNAYPLNIKP